MREPLKDALRRYGVAFLFTVAATWLRQVMGPLVGDGVPFGTHLVAVLLTAWLVGTGPAIVALLLGIVAAAHFIVPPANSLIPARYSDIMSLMIYGVVGAVAVSLFERTRRQHDLTRRQLQRIEALSAELQSADRRKDEFLALLSHELRNPLAPIRSGVTLLQDVRLEESRRGEVLQTISRQLEQLVRIVDDLLDVSRFVRGRIKLDCGIVDLRDLVRLAVEQVQPEIDAGHHDLQVTLPSAPVHVLGDRIRIVQIITNLLTNAAKYTPREGVIQARLAIDGRWSTVEVVDNGIGIAVETQPHIFELFTRSPVASGRDQSGLGLGLPIARQFAEMHDGSLEVSSDGPGRGSRFTLLLPLAAEGASLPHPAPAAPERVAVDKSQSGREEASPLRVLVVDDNTDAAETMATLLSLYDFESRTAADGPEALRLVAEFRPRVVLLDIGLPGMSGYEVARHLRATASEDDLRIIAVTGWGAESDFQKSRASGIDQHLIKPVDPAELLHLLQQPSGSSAVAV